MTNVQRALLHGSAATLMNYGWKSLGGLAIDSYMETQYGGHLQYLTIQGLGLAWLTMVLSLAHDSFPSFTILKTLKRYVMIIAMPLAVVISSIYWTLILFFPALILLNQDALKGPPGSAEPTSSSDAMAFFRIPLSLDLCLHALPAVAMILDFFLFEKKYSKEESRVAVPLTAVGYGVGYGLWVEHCAKHNNGVFPYPFLTDNNLNGRITIYAGATAIAVGSFKALNALHR